MNALALPVSLILELQTQWKFPQSATAPVLNGPSGFLSALADAKVEDEASPDSAGAAKVATSAEKVSDEDGKSSASEGETSGTALLQLLSALAGPQVTQATVSDAGPLVPAPVDGPVQAEVVATVFAAKPSKSLESPTAPAPPKASRSVEPVLAASPSKGLQSPTAPVSPKATASRSVEPSSNKAETKSETDIVETVVAGTVVAVSPSMNTPSPTATVPPKSTASDSVDLSSDKVETNSETEVVRTALAVSPSQSLASPIAQVTSRATMPRSAASSDGKVETKSETQLVGRPPTVTAVQVQPFQAWEATRTVDPLPATHQQVQPTTGLGPSPNVATQSGVGSATVTRNLPSASVPPEAKRTIDVNASSVTPDPSYGPVDRTISAAPTLPSPISNVVDIPAAADRETILPESHAVEKSSTEAPPIQQEPTPHAGRRGTAPITKPDASVVEKTAPDAGAPLPSASGKIAQPVREDVPVAAPVSSPEVVAPPTPTPQPRLERRAESKARLEQQVAGPLPQRSTKDETAPCPTPTDAAPTAIPLVAAASAPRPVEAGQTQSSPRQTEERDPQTQPFPVELQDPSEAAEPAEAAFSVRLLPLATPTQATAKPASTPPAPPAAPLMNQPEAQPADTKVASPAATAKVDDDRPHRPEKAAPAAPSSESKPEPSHFAPSGAVAASVEPKSSARATEPRTAELPAPPRAQDVAPARETPEPATSARDIKLQFSAEDGRIQVRLAERDGEVHVTVHAPDANLASALREDLPGLAAKLEQAGFRSEAWHGTAPQSADAPRMGETASGSPQDMPEPQHQNHGGQQQEQQQRQHRTPEEELAASKPATDFSWLFDSLR
ncbi:MAG TPA: hypothetical protein VG456_14725 [Candidatus Sulfopaludibacter sp.]|nr:hypothetical protein [Candidatus Sulfopaludibacter sp.]